MEKFDFELMYSHYLKVAGLDDSKLSTLARQHTRKTFAAGIASLIILLRIPTNTEEELVNGMERLHEQTQMILVYPDLNKN